MIQGIKHRLDYGDLQHTLADRNRYELLDGDLVVTPSPSPRHQWASKRLQRQLEEYFEGRELGVVWTAPLDVILTDHDVVVPDVVVMLDRTQLSDRGLEGAPALLIEILSPSSVSLDRITKARRYAALGVPHYWIVDVTLRAVECYRLENGLYELVVSASGDEVLRHPAWDGLEVRLQPLWM